MFLIFGLNQNSPELLKLFSRLPVLQSCMTPVSRVTVTEYQRSSEN